ncbi:MAG TPA: hypothetical protein VFQ35_28220 [Polyangiaceae bacterium]|nr:hypothetical protein [Polyangiaceae bacterium]
MSTGGAGAGGSEAPGSGGSTSLASGGRASGGASSGSGGGGSGSPPTNGGSCSKTDSPSMAACTVIESIGVFVSPKGSDDKGRGTRELPFKTLRTAITEARKQSKRVYACSTGGAFQETVTLDEASDQTELYGGFDCVDWTYAADAPTTVLSDTPRALVASELTSLVIEDFSFVAANAVAPGESSAAAWIANSKSVFFRRVSLTAGNGADGADGAGTKEPAPKGATGSSGVDACIAQHAPNEGGMEIESLCDGQPSGSIGGAGGDGGNDNKSALSGSPGQPITNDRGLPGVGQTATPGWNCAVTGSSGGGGAQLGSDAMSQPAAAGGVSSATAAGTLTADGFTGPAGQDGANGTPGQGGGGGGGAMAPGTCGGVLPRTGASGGGGGGGGCGGKGGKGGGAGGGSFALVSFRSSINLEGGVLTAQRGGNGGKGGYGQPGGAGGLGGSGGKGVDSSSACPGATGGKGGDGAHGGGGAGGPSAAIAVAGFQPVRQGAPLLKLSKDSSNGGDGGAGTGKGPGVGSAGLVTEVLSFDR